MRSHSLCCGTAISLTECLPESVLKRSNSGSDLPCGLHSSCVPPTAEAARVDLLDQQHASRHNVSPTK